jgi:hypothetical protein
VNQLFKTKCAWSKGQDESASRVGQFCHDFLPRTFDCVDIDCVIFKRATGMIRILEEKLPGEEVSKAQIHVLPKLAGLIELAVRGKKLPEGSGVFLLYHRNLGAHISEADDDDDVVLQKVPTNKCEMDRMPTWRGKFGDIRPWLSGEFQEIQFTVEAPHGR